MSAVTTHVLDAATGSPAVGMEVRLDRLEGEDPDRPGSGSWAELDAVVTDDDGRCPGIGPATVATGTYRLRFGTGAWFAAAGRESFYPEVVVTFAVADPARAHHHVPLLLSPFAYSTYRGS